MGIVEAIFFRNRLLERRRKEIETENRFKEMSFLIENPAKYKNGQVLADGTVISAVNKIMIPQMVLTSIGGEPMGTRFNGWHWDYEGVKDGKIISVN